MGQVQGVFFRAYIKKLAKELNLKGYVRNTNSDVEIHVNGDKQNLDKLIHLCKVGPEGAVIKQTKVEIENERSFKDFTIEY